MKNLCIKIFKKAEKCAQAVNRKIHYHRGTEQINKYIKNSGSQVSCRKKVTKMEKKKLDRTL